MLSTNVDGGDDKNYGIDWDHVLNYSVNFEKVIIKEYFDHALTINDNVVKDSEQLDFVISALPSDASTLKIDCSAENGADFNFSFKGIGGDAQYDIERTKFNLGKITVPPKLHTNIIGGDGDDSFYGVGTGDDIFKGNGGNDYFDGDDGNNTAVFRGLFNQYRVTESGWNA